MCVDANAAARNAARQRWMEKDARYRSESLKFFNREAQAVRGMQRFGTGFSRAISNDYQRARYVQGQAFAALEKGYSAYLGNKENVKALEGGMSRTAGRKSMLALLRAQGKLENAVDKSLELRWTEGLEPMFFGCKMLKQKLYSREVYDQNMEHQY